MATVDTDKKVIIAKNGDAYPYELEKRRQWNVGRRKHVMELTGNIIVKAPGNKYFFKAESFDAAKKKVDAEIVMKNPRSTNIAVHFKLDEWSAGKAAELNNTIRYYVNEGIPLDKAVAMVKKETVAGPKIWKAVNAMLKKHPPKKSGKRVLKPRVNPRRKSAAPRRRKAVTSRRVKLIKPNPVNKYVVAVLRTGKKPAYFTGTGSWDTDIKKARRYPTDAKAKAAAVALSKKYSPHYRIGYKKI